MRLRIYIGFLVSVLFLFSCKGKQEGAASNGLNPDVMKNPATASGEGSSEDMLPVFHFENESFDFGSIKEGESVTHEFKFKNTGKSELLISSANGSCGCTVPKYPKDPIAPGEEGIINVTFNSKGKTGKQNKTVTLIANTVPNSLVLTISGEVLEK